MVSHCPRCLGCFNIKFSHNPHLKPFKVASIQIANVSNMIRKMSTRSDSLLTGFPPVTSFILEELPVWFLTWVKPSDSFHADNASSMVFSSNQPTD